MEGTGVAHGQRGAEALNHVLGHSITNQVLPLLTMSGHTETIKRAVEDKGDPNVTNHLGIHALTHLIACHDPEHEGVALMLQHNAIATAVIGAKDIVEMFSEDRTKSQKGNEGVEKLEIKVKEFKAEACANHRRGHR